jgi:hypothetical protein
MTIEMDGKIKRWAARRKPASVLGILKTTVNESSRQFDLPLLQRSSPGLTKRRRGWKTPLRPDRKTS